MLALSFVLAASARVSAQRQLRQYVVAGARALWRAAGSAADFAAESLRRNPRERRCFVYTEVVLRRGSLLRIEHGRGLSIVVGEGRLWLTQDYRARDTEIGAGEQVRLDGDGMALASTDRDTRVTLCGDVPDRMPWRVTQVMRCGLRRDVCARDREEDMLRLPLPATARLSGC